MGKIVIENPAFAGMEVSPPYGKPVRFNELGIAEASDDCGLHSIPGFTLKEGVPKEMVRERGAIRPPDGPLVTVSCPAMAGQRASCPDGHTVAVFDAAGIARVPDTCGLDQVAGYAFVTEESEAKPAQPPPQQPQAAEQSEDPAQHREAEVKASEGTADDNADAIQAAREAQQKPVADPIQAAREAQTAVSERGADASVLEGRSTTARRGVDRGKR